MSLGSVQKIVKIFVGSPNDIAEDRRACIRTLRQLRDDFEGSGIVVEPFDYSQVGPDNSAPQEPIDLFLARADLVILIVGHRMGEGTRHELEFSCELRRRGELQSVMVFVQRPADPGGNGDSDSRDGLPRDMWAHPIEEKFSRTVLHHYFDDPEDLQSLLKKHAQAWLRPLTHLPRFLSRYGTCIDQGVLMTMRRQTPLRTDEIVVLDQLADDDRQLVKRSKRAIKEYLRARRLDGFAADPVKCYLVARYLYQKLFLGDPHDCRNRQFINPIHQYLASIVCDSKRADRYDVIVENLKRWLDPRSGCYATARDFAAFVLGMIRAENARFELLRAVSDRSELPAVRQYSAMSLGMIRQRDTLQPLIELHDTEPDPTFQYILAHAVLVLAGFDKQS